MASIIINSVTNDYNDISRHNFPADFVWGGATSAYQVEGAYAEAGKSLSNWDIMTLRNPGFIKDGSNGCEAIDQFNKYKEDIMMIKKLGVEAYRFSINWARVLPGGRLSAGVSRGGIKYYNDLIDFCLSQGIEPYVTIWHFDMPQCLEDEYGGFLSEKIVQDFAEYAEVCFFEFGDRVKYWVTMNEMHTHTVHSYASGYFPPNHGVTPSVARSLETNAVGYREYRRRGDELARIETFSSAVTGDPGTEPYICAHNMLLAHATAVDVYRKRYQAVQGGKIGVVNCSHWFEPLNDTEEDKAAAARAVDFMWGWFMSPIVHGDYPPTMRQIVGKRLPKFTNEQTELLIGSYDYIGMNYYTTNYATNAPNPPNTRPTYYTDRQVQLLTEKDGVPIGESPGSEWLFIVPRGIHSLLKHAKEDYNNPPIYITENGLSIINDKSLSVTQALKDEIRIGYFHDHLIEVNRARLEDGVDVRGYFLWSLFDNFEWAEGYTVRFGIIHVDYVNHLARYPKNSAIWWMNFLNKNIPEKLKRQIQAASQQEQETTPTKSLKRGRLF